jgi:hypothetical protein
MPGLPPRRGEIPVPGGDVLLEPPPIVTPQERAVMRTVFAIIWALSPDTSLAPKPGTVGAMRAQASFRRSENVEDVRDIQAVPLAWPITPPSSSRVQKARIGRVIFPPSPPLERVPPTSQIARDAGVEDLETGLEHMMNRLRHIVGLRYLRRMGFNR